MRTTEFGNVDVRKSVPQGYVHVSGKRLGPIARKVGARRWAPALVGFCRRYGAWVAEIDGIVCTRGIAPRIRAEQARLDETRAEREVEAKARKERRQERETAELADCIRTCFPHLADDAEMAATRAAWIGSGRVGRSTLLELDEKAGLTMAAHVRHKSTNYEELLRERPYGVPREEWREECRRKVAAQVREILEGAA